MHRLGAQSDCAAKKPQTTKELHPFFRGSSQEDDTEDPGPALAGGYYRGPLGEFRVRIEGLGFRVEGLGVLALKAEK